MPASMLSIMAHDSAEEVGSESGMSSYSTRSTTSTSLASSLSAVPPTGVSSQLALYRCDSIGKRMRGSKLRHSWTLRLNGDSAGTSSSEEVCVELLHSRLTGRKRIFLDGKEVHQTRKRSLSWSFVHPSQVRVTLFSEGTGFQLRCDDPEARPVGLDLSEEALGSGEVANSSASTDLPSWHARSVLNSLPEEDDQPQESNAPRSPHWMMGAAPTSRRAHSPPVLSSDYSSRSLLTSEHSSTATLSASFDVASSADTTPCHSRNVRHDTIDSVATKKRLRDAVRSLEEHMECMNTVASSDSTPRARVAMCRFPQLASSSETLASTIQASNLDICMEDVVSPVQVDFPVLSASPQPSPRDVAENSPAAREGACDESADTAVTCAAAPLAPPLPLTLEAADEKQKPEGSLGDAQPDRSEVSSELLEIVAGSAEVPLGLKVTWPPGKVKVKKVAKGGWAANAGVSVGAEIITVNGETAAEMQEDDLRATFQRRPLHLSVRPSSALAQDSSKSATEDGAAAIIKEEQQPTASPTPEWSLQSSPGPLDDGTPRQLRKRRSSRRQGDRPSKAAEAGAKALVSALFKDVEPPKELDERQRQDLMLLMPHSQQASRRGQCTAAPAPGRSVSTPVESKRHRAPSVGKAAAVPEPALASEKAKAPANEKPKVSLPGCVFQDESARLSEKNARLQAELAVRDAQLAALRNKLGQSRPLPDGTPKFDVEKECERQPKHLSSSPEKLYAKPCAAVDADENGASDLTSGSPSKVAVALDDVEDDAEKTKPLNVNILDRLRRAAPGSTSNSVEPLESTRLVIPAPGATERAESAPGSVARQRSATRHSTSRSAVQYAVRPVGVTDGPRAQQKRLAAELRPRTPQRIQTPKRQVEIPVEVVHAPASLAPSYISAAALAPPSPAESASASPAAPAPALLVLPKLTSKTGQQRTTSSSQPPVVPELNFQWPRARAPGLHGKAHAVDGGRAQSYGPVTAGTPPTPGLTPRYQRVVCRVAPQPQGSPSDYLPQVTRGSYRPTNVGGWSQAPGSARSSITPIRLRGHDAHSWPPVPFTAR